MIVVGLDPATGIGKGSGRSQPGVNLGRAVQAAFEADLVMSGGGHAMAAGLTVRRDTVPELRDFLCRRLAEEAAEASLADAIDIDVLVSPGAATRALFEDFQRLQPFGPGNPEPVFAVAGARVERPNMLRGGHIRCQLVDTDGGRLKAVAWRAGDTELGKRLLEGGSGLHLVGRLKADDWQGRTGVEFEIDDLADPRMSINTL